MKSYPRWNPSFIKIGTNTVTCVTKYTISSGKFKLASRYASATGTKQFVAAKSFTTSTKISTLNKDGVSIKSGQTFTYLQTYFAADGSLYYQVSKNGKTGWIKE